MRRIVALLLIPCLLADSAFANGVRGSAVQPGSGPSFFSEQALTARLRSRFLGFLNREPHVREVQDFQILTLGPDGSAEPPKNGELIRPKEEFSRRGFLDSTLSFLKVIGNDIVGIASTAAVLAAI